MSALPPGFVLDQSSAPALPAGFVLDGPSMGEDAAKSIGSGLANATAGTLGMAGDARSLLSAATDYAGSKLGIAPDRVQAFKDLASKAAQFTPPTSLLANAPTSRDVINSAPNPIVSPDYQPQTALGGYLKTGAEFLPAMADPELAGPGALKAIPKLFATRVAAPAVASETAGKLTEGTAAEPYARIAAAGFGGLAAAKAAEARAASSAFRAAAPESAEVKSAAQNTYDNLNSRNVATPIAQGELDSLADDITTTLNKNAIRPSTADKIHAAVDEIRSPATSGTPDVADLVAARENIKSLLSSPDRNKAGAFVALPKIEAAIERLSPGTMADLKTADKNYAAFKANEALDKRFARAELRAAGEHSGLNLGNRIRQQVTNYLTSNESKFLSKENRAALEGVVKGTPTQNGLRLLSNLMGGGGGLGSTLLGIGSAATGQATGHPELSLLPLGGFGTRMLANRSVSRQAARAAAQIRANSPLGQTRLAALPPPVRANIPASLLPALLATTSASQKLLDAYNR